MAQWLCRHRERPKIEAVALARNESFFVAKRISPSLIRAFADSKYSLHDGYTELKAKQPLLLVVKDLHHRSFRIAHELLFMREDRHGDPEATALDFAIHRIWKRAFGTFLHFEKDVPEEGEYSNALVYLDEVAGVEHIHSPEVFEEEKSGLVLVH